MFLVYRLVQYIRGNIRSTISSNLAQNNFLLLSQIVPLSLVGSLSQNDYMYLVSNFLNMQLYIPPLPPLIVKCYRVNIQKY